MQLIYQPIQDLTVLWCRWGRPGETGNHQQTPYGDRDEAIKEFKKIFKSKTLNEWENRDRKKFEPKRWRIKRLKHKRRHVFEHLTGKSGKNSKDRHTPHTLVNSLRDIIRSIPKEQRPPTRLPDNIRELTNILYDFLNILLLVLLH